MILYVACRLLLLSFLLSPWLYARERIRIYDPISELLFEKKNNNLSPLEPCKHTY